MHFVTLYCTFRIPDPGMLLGISRNVSNHVVLNHPDITLMRLLYEFG